MLYERYVVKAYEGVDGKKLHVIQDTLHPDYSIFGSSPRSGCNVAFVTEGEERASAICRRLHACLAMSRPKLMVGMSRFRDRYGHVTEQGRCRVVDRWVQAQQATICSWGWEVAEPVKAEVKEVEADGDEQPAPNGLHDAIVRMFALRVMSPDEMQAATASRQLSDNLNEANHAVVSGSRAALAARIVVRVAITGALMFGKMLRRCL